MNTEAKTKYKRHDKVFKRPTAEHWLVSGKPATRVAAASLPELRK